MSQLSFVTDLSDAYEEVRSKAKNGKQTIKALIDYFEVFLRSWPLIFLLWMVTSRKNLLTIWVGSFVCWRSLCEVFVKITIYWWRFPRTKHCSLCLEVYLWDRIPNLHRSILRILFIFRVIWITSRLSRKKSFLLWRVCLTIWEIQRRSWRIWKK